MIHKCGGEYTYSMDFCPKCGQQVLMLKRSDNEIKMVRETLDLEFKSISNIQPCELLVFIYVKITLEWVLGDKYSPLSLIGDMKNLREKNANKNP